MSQIDFKKANNGLIFWKGGSTKHSYGEIKSMLLYRVTEIVLEN